MNASVGDEYARQLAHIRDRLRSYPEGHTGLQIAAMMRMSDLIRLGRFEDVRRISAGQRAWTPAPRAAVVIMWSRDEEGRGG